MADKNVTFWLRPSGSVGNGEYAFSAQASVVFPYIPVYKAEAWHFTVYQISGTPVGSLQVSSSGVPYNPLVSSSIDHTFQGVAQLGEDARGPLNGSQLSAQVMKETRGEQVLKAQWIVGPSSNGTFGVVVNLKGVNR